MFEPSRSDWRLLARTLTEGWKVPPEMRTKIIDVLFEITNDGEAKKRERMSAARALMQASRVELDAIRLAMEAEGVVVLDRLEALEGKGGGDGQLAKAASEG